MKKLVSLIIIAALMASSFCLQAYASDSSTYGENMQLNSETSNNVEQDNFIEAVRPFFDNPSGWKVLTADEIDISNEFYSDSIQAYLNKDYISIYQNWGDTIKYVDLIQPYNQINSDNAQIGTDSTGGISLYTSYMSKGVSKNNLCFWAEPGITTFEFTISMSGSYTVNILDGIISNASYPSVVLTDYTYPTNGACYIGIITRQATISSNKQQVTFYATFHCYREFDMGNVDDCGLYEASLVGDPNGTLISYSPVTYGYPIS